MVTYPKLLPVEGCLPLTLRVGPSPGCTSAGAARHSEGTTSGASIDFNRCYCVTKVEGFAFRLGCG